MRLSRAQVKFCQIPYASFEITSRFLSKFCIPLHFYERLFLCSFLAQTIYSLLNRSPLKWKSLRLSSAWVLESKFVKFLMSISKWRSCNFIKKETLAQVFSREFCNISKNTFFYKKPLVAASGFTNFRLYFFLSLFSYIRRWILLCCLTECSIWYVKAAVRRCSPK